MTEESRVQISAGARYSFWAPPSGHLMFFPWGKGVGAWRSYPLPSCAEVKNGWSCTFVLPHVFMALVGTRITLSDFSSLNNISLCVRAVQYIFVRFTRHGYDGSPVWCNMHEMAKIRDKKSTARNLSSTLPVKVDCLWQAAFITGGVRKR